MKNGIDVVGFDYAFKCDLDGSRTKASNFHLINNLVDARWFRKGDKGQLNKPKLYLIPDLLIRNTL